MTTNPSLTETAWSQCEAVIRQFEAAWRAGRPTDVGSFVSPDSPLRVRLLVELVHVDLEFRLRANEDARVEDYIGRFPELTGKDLTLDLVAAEYALRSRYRPPVSPAEFWLRFPKHEAELRALLTASAPQHGFQLTREAPGEPCRRLDGPPLIPGCQIQGELGRGGMGVVYKARDLLLNRFVAVKTMATVPAAESRARFAREAESIARLDHPHIVPVYEVGEWGPEQGPKVPFFTMKWYPGGSLDETPSGVGTDPLGHAQLMETIARAVHHAHRRGVLHLDLKPSNILLDDAGAPHVADFGLAGWFDPMDPRSVLGGAVGTPAYMAPEQARPAGRVTLAADVYGLGAVLYQLLTGQPPFNAATAIGTLELVMHADPQRPSAINPTVPIDLEAVCLKCLDKEAAKRYATAEEVADDLARWRTGRPVLARPTPAPERAWRLIRRHPLLSSMAVTTIAALVATVVVLAITNAQVRTKEQEAQSALQRAHDAHQELTATLDREQLSLYHERVAAAGRLYQMNHLEQAWHTLDQCPTRYRGWEWDYLDGLRKNAPIVLRGDPEGIYSAAYLSDGRLIATDANHELRVWRPDGTFSTISQYATRVAAHPTRNLVALGDNQGITIWDVDNNRPIRRILGREWMGFSPDGSLFALAKETVLTLWSVDTWESVGELKGHTQMVTSGAFTRDGRTLYSGSVDRTIRVWNLDKRQPHGEPWPRPLPPFDLAVTANGKTVIEAMPSRLQFTDASTGRPWRPAESAPSRPWLLTGPDTTWFATNTTTGEVVVRSTDTGQLLRTYRGHTGNVAGLTLNRSGSQLASYSFDGTIRLNDPTTTPEYTDLSTNHELAGTLSLSADRKRLLVAPRAFTGPAEGTARVFDLTTNKEVLSIPGTGDGAMDPTGRWFAVCKPTGELVVRDASSGAELKTLVSNITILRIRFSPDGRYLAAAEVRRKVRVWNTETWTELEPFIQAEGAAVLGLTWSPTSEQVAITRAQTVELWSLQLRSRTHVIPTEQAPNVVAFSPTGDTIVIAGRRRLLALYDVKSSQLIRPFIGNPSVVNALAFHPRGNRLATAGADGRVRIWDIDSGQEVLSLPTGDQELFGITWTANGQQLIASGALVRSWRIQ